MTCTRCQGCGFLNIEQLPAYILKLDPYEFQKQVKRWIDSNDDHDVSVCDCCGDGDDWYGESGQHYGTDDPRGPDGPYASNGGLCSCH